MGIKGLLSVWPQPRHVSAGAWGPSRAASCGQLPPWTPPWHEQASSSMGCLPHKLVAGQGVFLSWHSLGTAMALNFPQSELGFPKKTGWGIGMGWRHLSHQP